MTQSAHNRCYLIVNGDDFGLSPQVNAGILYAHHHGILTNASLMVTGPAWHDAVVRAQETPTLSVGLHLTLAQGCSVLPPHLIPALTDFGRNFPDNPTWAGLRYFFSPRARLQVRDECRAQIEKFLATGLSLSHIDGHVNIHMHPVVQDTLVTLLPEYDIPAIRITQENLSVSLTLDPQARLRKRWESLIFSQLARRARNKFRRVGIISPDRLFGLHQSGALTEEYLLRLLSQLEPGVTELYCHPAFLPCSEVQRWTPYYRRDVELAALTSSRVQAAVREKEISLLSYRSLPEVSKPAVSH